MLQTCLFRSSLVLCLLYRYVGFVETPKCILSSELPNPTDKQALYPVVIILLVALENNKEEDRNVFSLSQSLRFITEAQSHVPTLGDLGGSEAG